MYERETGGGRGRKNDFNRIEEWIEILKFVNWFIQKQMEETDPEIKEFLDDIHIKLCSLMTAMIASPLSRRMFLMFATISARD